MSTSGGLTTISSKSDRDIPEKGGLGNALRVVITGPKKKSYEEYHKGGKKFAFFVRSSSHSPLLNQ